MVTYSFISLGHKCIARFCLGFFLQVEAVIGELQPLILTPSLITYQLLFIPNKVAALLCLMMSGSSCQFTRS